MDWRKNGEELRELMLSSIDNELRQIRENAADPDNILLVKYDPEIGAPNINFVRALLEAESGNDWTPLNRYLRENLLKWPEQLLLANTLEAPKRAKTGRPKNMALLAAEAIATNFYERWRRVNERRGISDYGHRDEMKDYAACFGAEIGCLYPERGSRTTPKESDIEKVREMMDRPKHRRKSLDEVIDMASESKGYRQKP